MGGPVADRDHRLAGTSRFSRCHLICPDDEEGRLSFLLDLGERAGLANWTLFASADSTAAFVARHHAELAGQFRLTTPPWSSFRWAYDKRLTYALTAGLVYPGVHPDQLQRAGAYTRPFPAILKPGDAARLDGPRARRGRCVIARSCPRATARSRRWWSPARS